MSVRPSKSVGMLETPREELHDQLDDLMQEEVLDAVAHFVRTCFRRSAEHRRNLGIDQAMDYAQRSVRNEYEPEDQALLDGIDVYMGVTNLKVRALKSWITDILTNAEDQPWTIKATPVPELPAFMQEAVVQRVMQEMQQYGGMPEEAVKTRARQLKEIARKFVNKKAAEAATGMESRIKDDLLEGGWRDAFDGFVTDLAMYPLAVLKGPFMERRPVLQWRGNKLETVDKLMKVVKRVDPYNFFPSPNTERINEGAYVIERIPLLNEQVLDLIDSPGFDELAIRAALDEYPTGHRCEFRDSMNGGSMMGGVGVTGGDMVGGASRTNYSPDMEYEILVYSGKVPADLLQEHGLAMDYDPQHHCEAEIWVLGQYVLKAMLNPHPLGHRPYYATSFQRIPGCLWGMSLPMLMEDVQRVCNSTARSLIRNMGYASGPVVEADASRLGTEVNMDVLEPWRVYMTESPALATNPNPAIRFNVVPTIANELLKVYDEFSKKADDISGIPSYVLGSPQVAGAGRTLGGLSMLMGNAAKGVKQVIANVDRNVIEPLIQQFYTLEMLFGEDATIKADVKVLARGSSGILQRELTQARATETLQILTPYVQAGIVPPSSVKLLLRETLKSLGYNADDFIDDPDREQQVRSAAGIAAAPGPGGAPGVQQQLPGVGGPPGQPGAPPRIPSARKLKRPGPGTPIASPERLNTPGAPKLDNRSRPATSPDLFSRLPSSEGM